MLENATNNENLNIATNDERAVEENEDEPVGDRILDEVLEEPVGDFILMLDEAMEEPIVVQDQDGQRVNDDHAELDGDMNENVFINGQINDDDLNTAKW